MPCKEGTHCIDFRNTQNFSILRKLEIPLESAPNHDKTIISRDGYQEITMVKSVVTQLGQKMDLIQKPRLYKLDVNNRFILVSAYTFWPYIIFVCLKGS